MLTEECRALRLRVQTTPGPPRGRGASKRCTCGEAHRSYVCMVREGMANVQSDPEAGPEGGATVAISTIEGAVMMSKLYRTNQVHRQVNHLSRYLVPLVR